MNAPALCASCPRLRSEPFEHGSLPPRRYIPPDGLGTNGVMVVGEGPWIDETLALRNFAGASGSLLERMMRRVGTSREQYFVTNCAHCRWPHLGWADHPERCPDAAPTLEHCRPILEREIEEMAPRCFLLLGNIALQRVAGVSGVEANAAYVLPTPYGVPAVAAYHPAYILRGKQKLQAVDLFALKRALALAAGTETVTTYDLLLDPTPEELHSYIGGLPVRIPDLVVDIETPESANLDEEEAEEAGASYTIIRAGFSARQGEAVTFPFAPPYIEILQEVLDRADLMVEHADNHFDSRRLRAAGMRLPSRIASSMWCLARDTQVMTWERNKIAIEKLVDERLSATLLGMDEEGKPIPVRVVGWHKQSVREQKWIRLMFSPRSSVQCTPDHRVWTPSGWKFAEDVVVGDLVQSPRKGSSSLIHGTLLGDGYATKFGGLIMIHSSRQRAWVERKATNLGAHWFDRSASGKGVVGDIQAHATVGKGWRNLFYPQGKKVFIPPPDDAALAVWYCDDGCWNKWCGSKKGYQGNPNASWKRRTWHAGDGRAAFAIAGFALHDQQRMAAWFSVEFGHDVSISGREHNVLLYVKRDARDLFFSRIAQYVPPEMQYKIPSRWRGKYNGWLEQEALQWDVVSDIRVKTIDKPSIRYCVTVDHPTHRFFTSAALVSNCFHFLQSDLRKGLGACAPFFYCGAPWKHLSESQPAWYNAMDNAVTMDVWTGTREKLVREGRWAAFERHCIAVEPLLVRMGRAGIIRNDAKRDVLKADLLAKCDAIVEGVQVHVPDAVKPLYPKDGYKKGPKDAEHAPAAAGEGAKLIEHDFGPELGVRQCWLKRFNPNSSDQVIELIRSLGFKVPKKRGDDGEDKETSEAKHLKRLAKKNRIFRDILLARQLDTYATLQLMTMPLNGEGRLVTTFGFHPWTWRKSSRNANMQVFPKRAELAAKFLEIFEAAPGHRFVCADAAAIEAVLVGYFARSERYIALAKAGIHDWLTSVAARQPVPLSLLATDPRAFKAAVKVFKRTHHDLRERCKRIVHMSNYVATPERIWEEYPEDFETVRDAKELQDLYFQTEPGQDVRRWQREVCDRAHKETRLDNPFQYRFYFYSVYDFNYQKYKRLLSCGMPEGEARKAAQGLGEDAKRAVAALPQSTASAIQTEVLLGLGARESWIEPHLRLIVHDDIKTEPPEEEWERTADALHREMTVEWPQLGGLSIGVEVSTGHNLGPRSDSNPRGMTTWEPPR